MVVLLPIYSQVSAEGSCPTLAEYDVADQALAPPDRPFSCALLIAKVFLLIGRCYLRRRSGNRRIFGAAIEETASSVVTRGVEKADGLADATRPRNNLTTPPLRLRTSAPWSF